MKNITLSLVLKGLLFSLALTGCKQEGFYEKDFLTPVKGQEEGEELVGEGSDLDDGLESISELIDGDSLEAEEEYGFEGPSEGEDFNEGQEGQDELDQDVIVNNNFDIDIDILINNGDNNEVIIVNGDNNEVIIVNGDDNDVNSNDRDDSENGEDGSENGDEHGDDLKSDSFVQSSERRALDILWVIDNSGSMADEQRDLAYNFEVFINDFIQNDVDFQMAITTTDVSRGHAGNNYQASAQQLNSTKAANNREKFVRDFQRMIQVGTNGSWQEKGLEAAKLNLESNQYFRDDAYLVVVFVSDEDDQSPQEVADYVSLFSQTKSNAGLVKAHSIVSMKDLSNNTNPYLSPGNDRYREVSNLTNGEVSDVDADFHETLSSMSESIYDLVDSFPLSEEVSDESTIKVYLDGQEQIGNWSYNSTSNTVKFQFFPDVGSEIQVEYL